MSATGLPEAFVRAVSERIGDELPEFLASYDRPAVRGLRMNPAKPVPGEVRPEGLLDPIPWATGGFFLSAESRAGSHPLHEAGAWYIQDPSAMVPAAVLNAQPGETVLDLCAAPGGKTTQMAAAMRGQGLLICNEPVPSRAQVLSRNLERMGVTNALCVSAWPQDLAKRWPGCFDAVLVDAPCSGEGMFRRVPESRAEWTPASPTGCAARQAEILDAAAGMVRPGGRIVYATCTLNRTENEDTVAGFLERHPDYRLKSFALPEVNAPEGVWTAWPHRFRGEGQFCALLVRSGDEPKHPFVSCDLPLPTKDEQHAVREFCGNAPLPTGQIGGTLVSLPGCPALRGLKVLRCGLHLGTLKGKVFHPDHAWAVSAAPPELPHVPLTDTEALRYQAGEALQVPEHYQGWVLPTLAGLPLGFGKVTNGVMKNHYPKGLRRSAG